MIGNFGGEERADGLAHGTVVLVNEYLGWRMTTILVFPSLCKRCEDVIGLCVVRPRPTLRVTPLHFYLSFCDISDSSKYLPYTMQCNKESRTKEKCCYSAICITTFYFYSFCWAV
jgi:hypothetical protein